jgi:hypothetical protein
MGSPVAFPSLDWNSGVGVGQDKSALARNAVAGDGAYETGVRLQRSLIVDQYVAC